MKFIVFFANFTVTPQFDPYCMDISNMNIAKLCYLLLLKLFTKFSGFIKRILDILDMNKSICEKKNVESAMVTFFSTKTEILKY